MSAIRRLLLWTFVLLALPAHAHPEWKEAYCLGVIDEDNRFDFFIKFDVPSYLLGKHPKEATVKELDDLMFDAGRLPDAYVRGPADFLKGTKVFVDDVEVPVEMLAFPDAAAVKAQSTKQGEADRYPVLLNARFRARIPAGAGKVEVMFPRALGSVLTNLRRGMDSQVLMTVPPGERGEFIIGEVQLTLRGFIREGFAHVIPEGWDHCLFMLAMFLGAASLGQALSRSLIFTVGHSITLSLVAFGLLPPVGGWIEPVIAATIGVGGALAFWGKATGRQMLLVPLTFGLVHGLGFAAAVTDKLAEWRHAQVVQVLVGFNVGVELAQVSVILLAALLLAGLVRLRANDALIRRALCAAVAVA
ncbi:MAG: hypothetical protein RL250_1915, partial [Verrucomicrobiota bacterium]